MLPRNSQDVDGREASRLATLFDVELRADPPDELRSAAFRGEHPAQEKQLARLHRLHIRAEWLGRFGKLEAQFLQPLLGAGGPRLFAGYPTSPPQCSRREL